MAELFRRMQKKKSNGGDGFAQALVVCQQAPWDCRLACCTLPVQHPGKSTLLRTGRGKHKEEQEKKKKRERNTRKSD
ncbi:MAG: hypothetical protein FRX49_13813 [Trebouxia sp. A1-2]|nr:MAG: hypothetical protein FRX49_13813 [Trebouxia sp. A1-2]